MRVTLGLIAVALIALWFLFARGQRASDTLLSPAASFQFMTQHAADPAFMLVDVRTPSEYAAARIAGARLMDVHSPGFRSSLERLPRDGRYLVYCRSGNRSGSAVRLMRALGFTDVHDMQGGITAWQAARFPVETGAVQQ